MLRVTTRSGCSVPVGSPKEVTLLSVETFMDGLSAARRTGRISEDFYDQVTHLAWAVHETQRIVDALGDAEDDTFKDLGDVREALLGALEQFRLLGPRTAEDVRP
jgi:hypothetical protein